MPRSAYLANALLDHVLGGVAYTPPANVYAGLFTVLPTQYFGGTEVSAGGYARVLIANNVGNWPSASNFQKWNANDILFPVASADWGTILGWGIWDLASVGNLLHWGPLNPVAGRLIKAGDQFKFPLSGMVKGILITETAV